MTHYATCMNCAADKSACARRSEIRAAIKGTGVTSVKFRCDARQPMFHSGQRVEVTWPVFYDDKDCHAESWPATVIDEIGARFLINVDDVVSDYETRARDYIQNERLFAKVSPSRLSALDEPDRSICDFCGKAPAPGSTCPELIPDAHFLWPETGLPNNCAALVAKAGAS